MNIRMHKTLALLLALWLGANVTAAFAQQKLCVWKANGSLSTTVSTQVDSLTFTARGAFAKLEIVPTEGSVTENGLEATASILLKEQIKAFDVTHTVGICYSGTNPMPTISDLTRKLGTNFDTYHVQFTNLMPGTTYYFRPYVTILDETCYGNVYTVTTTGVKTADRSRTVNGHSFVDLGLPSGTLWAETNVGAESAESAGSYFAWGETTTKTSYTESNSTWYGTAHTGNLTATEDAATVLWGEGVRTPTYDEMSELVQNCVWTWTAVNGTKGYRVGSATNSNSIFLPVTGKYSGEELSGKSIGNYWTSTQQNDFSVYSLTFANGLQLLRTGNCYFGQAVRPVANAN